MLTIRSAAFLFYLQIFAGRIRWYLKINNFFLNIYFIRHSDLDLHSKVLHNYSTFIYQPILMKISSNTIILWKCKLFLKWRKTGRSHRTMHFYILCYGEQGFGAGAGNGSPWPTAPGSHVYIFFLSLIFKIIFVDNYKNTDGEVACFFYF